MASKTYSHLGTTLIVLAIIACVIITVGVISTKQLQTVDASCTDLQNYNPFDGGISVHNSTSGQTAYFTSGTLCSYDFDYHYHYLPSYIVPGILLIISAIMFWKQKKEDDKENKMII